MTSIHLFGNLTGPINSEPLAHAIIRITSLSQSEDDILKGVSSEVRCGELGGYDFSLAYGQYRIEVKFHKDFVFQGNVFVHSEVVATTLQELLKFTTPPQPS